MKRAVIFGDLSADSTSDQYPTVTLCDDCIAKDEKLREDSQIVSIDGNAPDDSESCEWCGAEE
jgi:hypothetical protein